MTTDQDHKTVKAAEKLVRRSLESLSTNVADLVDDVPLDIYTVEVDGRRYEVTVTPREGREDDR